MAPVAVRRSARLQRRRQESAENNTELRRSGADSRPQHRASRKTQKLNRVSKAIKTVTKSSGIARRLRKCSSKKRDTMSTGQGLGLFASEDARQCGKSTDEITDCVPSSDGNWGCSYCPPSRSPSRCFHNRGNPLAQANAPPQSTASVWPTIELDDTDAQNVPAHDPTCNSTCNSTKDGCPSREREQSAPSGDRGHYFGKVANEEALRAAYDAFLARNAEIRRLMHGSDTDIEDHVCLKDDDSVVDYYSISGSTLVGSPELMQDDESADNMAVEPTSWTTYEPCWLSTLDCGQSTEASPASSPSNEATSGSRSSTRATDTPRTSPIHRNSESWTLCYYPARHNGDRRDHAQTVSTKDYVSQRRAHCASNAYRAGDEEPRYYQMNTMRNYNRQSPNPMQPLTSQVQSQHGTSTLERQGAKRKQFEAHMPRSEEPDETHHTDAHMQHVPPQYVGSGFIPQAYM